jgi:hypothetical protein
MIFDVYLDESGTHAGSPALTVAGYLSVAERWGVFSAQWQTMLDDFGIKMFHMTSLANHAPPFDTWGESRRRELFATAVSIINPNVLASFAFTVPMFLYDDDSVFPEFAKAFVSDAYGLMTFGLVMEVAEYVKKLAQEIGDPDPWVAYIMESGANGTGKVQKMFMRHQRDPDSRVDLRLLSLSFENKRQFLPLQAADIVAYECYQHIPRQLGIVPRAARVFNLKPLAEVPHVWRYYNKTELEKIASITAGKIQSWLKSREGSA